MSVVSIDCVKYADSILSGSMVFQGGNSDIYYPIIFAVYIIKTDNAIILFDAGCNTMPGFDMRNFIRPSNAIEKFGISADDVTDIIISHSHHDHIDAVKDFKNALIHIQIDEYQSGKDYIPNDAKLDIFENITTVDNSINVIKIGGHSKGSCIAQFDFNGKIYVICGDECYTRDNLTRKITTGCSYCPPKSREFIEKYSSERYVTLLCHDK